MLVAAGADHSCAGSDEALYCWGLDNNGQLGDGANHAPLGAAVMVQRASGASALVSGYLHSCAVTLGSVQCWGSNLQLMLGVTESNDPFSSDVPLTLAIFNAR
jgi:alpha-tubulin suppressor-like RCC1 family protein